MTDRARGTTMTKDEVLTLLRAHKAALSQRFGVTQLALYGSFARDQAAADSDVHILVRFTTPPSWRQYFDVHAYLEDLLGRPVDMATHKELRAEIRPYLEREVVNV